MNRHFTTFTAATMGALRQSMTDSHAARRELLTNLRGDLTAHLDMARKQRQDFEDERRQKAADDRSSRQMFMETMSATVESLRASTQKLCEEMAADRLALAEELHAARQAFMGACFPSKGQASKG